MNQTTQIIFNANPLEFSYEDAQNELNEIEQLIMQELILPIDNFSKPSGEIEFNSNFLKKEFLDAVNLAKSYIREGDVMQVVLAQDFSTDFGNFSF